MWKSESPCSQSTGPQVYTLAVLLLLLRAPLTFYVVGTVRISWPRVSSNPGSFRPQCISIYYYTTIVDHYNFFSDTHIHIFRDVNYWCRQIGRQVLHKSQKVPLLHLRLCGGSAVKHSGSSVPPSFLFQF